jgi:hypothetical protein
MNREERSSVIVGNQLTLNEFRKQDQIVVATFFGAIQTDVVNVTFWNRQMKPLGYQNKFRMYHWTVWRNGTIRMPIL